YHTPVALGGALVRLYRFIEARTLLHEFCRVFGGGRNGVEPASVCCQLANGTAGSPAVPGVDHGAICPMFDLGVTVTIAHAAGVVVIGGGNINPGMFGWDFEKIAIVDAPRVLIDKKPGIGGSWSGQIACLFVNEIGIGFGIGGIGIQGWINPGVHGNAPNSVSAA